MSVRRSGVSVRDERGAVAIFTAIVAVVLLLISALVVDIGSTWARRGQLQSQADQAALLAAQSLPATSDTARLDAARAVAWTVACDPVAGQAQLNPGIPACPSSPTSSTLVSYAQSLLDSGRVDFPRSNQVRVRTPEARIEYGFGRAAGADGSTQTRVAIAQVSSPGSVSPMALSLNCLLSAAGSLPAGLGNIASDVLPLNYIAPGPITIDNGGTTKWPSMPSSNGITLGTTLLPALLDNGTTQGVGVTTTAAGSGWGVTVPGIGPDVQLAFARGDMSAASIADLPKADVGGLSLGLVGTGLVTIPAEVISKAGTWEVRVGTNKSGSWEWSAENKAATFTVDLPTVTQDLLGCARLVKSPRGMQDGTPGNLQLNLREGLDHNLTTHPQVAQLSLPSPLTVPNLLSSLNGPAGLFKCNSGDDVKDTGGSLSKGLTPNCMVLQQGSSTYSEFTEGILGSETTVPEDPVTGAPARQVAGRLICTSAKPCGRSFTLTVDGTTRTVNDDRLEDFIIEERRSLLTHAAFFNLSTYLLDGIPAVTPDSAFESDLYASHRFMWAPVISAPNVTESGNDAGSYPILTFRPIFITQDVPSGIGLDSVDMVLDLVDLWVRTLLGIDATDDHGLVMSSDGNTLRALRFMTIEPTALPAVMEGYAGPVTDYLGVGPKIIRLVR